MVALPVELDRTAHVALMQCAAYAGAAARVHLDEFRQGRAAPDLARRLAECAEALRDWGRALAQALDGEAPYWARDMARRYGDPPCNPTFYWRELRSALSVAAVLPAPAECAGVHTILWALRALADECSEAAVEAQARWSLLYCECEEA